MNLLYLFVILFLCFVLSRTTDLTTRSLRNLSGSVRVNELLLSFFFLGAVTSIPELFVAITAALEGVPELALGNLLGANIVVLSLMVGITALLSGRFSIYGFLRKADFHLSLFMVALPLLFILDGALARWEGAALLGAFGYFLLHFYQRRHMYQSKIAQECDRNSSRVKNIGLFTLSVALLLGVSYLLVEVALLAAAAWSVPLLLIGLLLLSLGTNVPELGFVFQQAFKRHAGERYIAVGILLGNVVINTPILGLLALLHPFEIAHTPSIWITSAFLSIIILSLGRFLVSERRITRFEGLFLMLLYGFFVFYILTEHAGSLGL